MSDAVVEIAQLREFVDVMRWVVGLLTTAIGGLSVAIGVMWKKLHERSEACEREKAEIYDRWMKDVASREEERRTDVESMRDEYKRLLEESVRSLKEAGG